MLPRPAPPFVCPRCVVRALARPRAPASPPAAHRSGRPPARFAATLTSPPPAAATFGQASFPSAQPNETGSSGSKRQPRIRERLAQWQQLHGPAGSLDLPLDVSVFGSMSNTISRTQATGSSAMDLLHAGGPTVAVDSRYPGDLVELRQNGSRVPLLAVYLGFFSGCNHFYASNGRWVTSMGFSYVFAVPGFAALADLEPILAKIPKDATPEDLDDMRRNFKGPTREAGLALIRKMSGFKNRAETICYANLARLEEARARLAHDSKLRYLSLTDVADALLPETLKTDGRFSSPALYAVHTAIHRQDVGFRLINVSSDCHSLDHLIEVFPRDFIAVVDNVVAMVREYNEARGKYSKTIEPADLAAMTFGQFLTQARRAVSNSRKARRWTPHGILEATRGVELSETKWSRASMDVITYLEWWACYDLFNLGSPHHSTGALVLRALELYDGVHLDPTTAWVFLQEIGRIAPWEIPSRYKPRLPGVTVARGAGLSRDAPHDLEASRRPDIAADVRAQKVGGDTVFCIDAPSTTLIDDGISLGRTADGKEFWLHIHVADPASVIKPESELRKFMELIPENIYLPGHFQAMIPPELGEDEAGKRTSDSFVGEFSLQRQGPTLTFSAKVNAAGEILDYKLEPGTLGNVLYLDPENVAKFCNEPSPPVAVSTGHCIVAGTPPSRGPPTAPQRPMVAAEDLAEDAQNDLLTLHRLADAVRQQRLSKGAWPYFFPRPSVSVLFDPPSADSTSSEPAITVPADPYIEVKTEASTGCSVVANTMVLAGEIAARWCASRNIPIPYRRDIKSAHNREAALDYVSSKIYPLIQQGIEPSPRQRQELFDLTGGVEISADPGPYFLMGLDMYAKATSPLRRFGDLLVHWQIHAALAFERDAGRRIDPAVDRVAAIVPFAKEALGDSLRMLQMREKKTRRISRGVLDWILIALVRAWRFEGRPPPALRFTVGMRVQAALYGRLDLFDLDAVLDPAGLDGLLLIKDVRLGDQFEVELVDVNVHSREVLLRATRYLGQPSPSPPPPQSTGPAVGGESAPAGTIPPEPALA